MKKLLLALILLLLSIISYAQKEEDVVYYNITGVSYKTGVENNEIVWSEWVDISEKLRVDYFIQQQTITIINDHSKFYRLESCIDSTRYEDMQIKSFIARDDRNNKYTIEFMIPDFSEEFFIVITDKKDEIVMYKIE